MLRSSIPVLVLVLAACGAPAPPMTAVDAPGPAAAPDAAPAPAESAGTDAADEAAEGAPSVGAAPAEAPPSEAEALARDFVKSGGRRIGYSATKGFAYPYEQRREDGFRLDIVFADDAGRRKDVMQVCDYSACAEKLDEISRELLPRLATRLEEGGYTSIRGIGWPSGRDELEVNTLKMKLRYAKGRLEGLREGKPAVTLGSLGASVPDAPELLAVFVIPDTKLLGVFARPGARAPGVVQELYVLKLP